MRNDLTRIRKEIQSSEQIMQNQDIEIQKLAQIIAEADEERIRQKKELDGVLSERDLLMSQLIKRNEELAVLYEKIKVNKSTLTKGESQYEERIAEIRAYRERISELKGELQVWKKKCLLFLFFSFFLFLPLDLVWFF